MIKAELHCHTNYSDGRNYKLMIKAAVSKGLDVLAITDHNTFKAYKPAVKYAEEKGLELLILPGEEVNVKQGLGMIELLAYGITKEIKPGQGIEEAIDEIHEQGGLCVAPHPYHPLYGVKGLLSLKTRRKEYEFDGVEVWNHKLPYTLNKPALKMAGDKFMTGGSDAHHPITVGSVINELKMNEEPAINNVLKALKDKENNIIIKKENYVNKTIKEFAAYIR